MRVRPFAAATFATTTTTPMEVRATDPQYITTSSASTFNPEIEDRTAIVT